MYTILCNDYGIRGTPSPSEPISVYAIGAEVLAFLALAHQ